MSTDRPAELTVVGVLARSGAGEREVVRFVLGHGADPQVELGRLGWVGRLVDVEVVTGGLVFRYAVEATEPVEPPEVVVPTDAGLVRGDGEAVEPYQRTAAYGVVTSNRGVLLTELSELTSSPGLWTLPGGGLDPGESPQEALHREVWEESGQRVTDLRLLDIRSSHWVGRAPSGRLEDYHAVRIVYAAVCREPTDPVVHDVGGSTAAVRWVPRPRLAQVPLTPSFAPHLERWLDT